MLKINEKFSPRANPPDANYPYGSIKNESVPGAKDGTPLDAGWGNDLEGFKQAALAQVGMTPSGLPDTAVNSQLLTALKSYKLSAVAAFVRSQNDVNEERVSITDFGAVADNFLADGVTLNPSRTNNSAAFQAAVTWCENTDTPTVFDRALYIPGNARGYWIPVPVFTSEETGQFTNAITRSLKISGDGKSSILVGQGGAPATYTLGVNDGSESIFRIHRSNVIWRELQFRDAPNAVYIGQNPDSIARSTHTNMNHGDNIWFQNCGTCYLNQPGKTNYNNNLTNFQMQGYQIGIHNGLPVHSTGTELDVSNRNNYSFFSLNNGWCAILFENGDTNTFSNGTMESNNGLDTVLLGAVGPAPAQITDGIASAIYSDQTAHAYGVNTHKWSNIECEANTRDLYLDGSGWGFTNVFMDSTKVFLGPNGVVPTWISTNSPAASGKFANYHMGDLHIKSSIGITDPFNPTAGTASKDRGLYIDGGRISDTEGRRESYDISADADVNSVDAGDTKSRILGGEVSWHVNVKVTKNASVGVNDPIVLTLPRTTQIDTLFNNMKVTATVQSDVSARGFTEITFVTDNNKISIAAPTNGWSTSNNLINFHLTWFLLGA